MTTPGEPLGLLRGHAIVVPWDERWPGLFDIAAKEIVAAVGPSILMVHHVGSTSVPGLCAKPIIDILVSILDLGSVQPLLPRLEPLGYEFRADHDIPDRRYFRRPPGGDVRTHHLSFAEPSSRHHRVTIAFRDALRANPRLAAEYASLKEGLARKFPRDRAAYIEGKTDFVMRVLASVGVET